MRNDPGVFFLLVAVLFIGHSSSAWTPTPGYTQDPTPYPSPTYYPTQTASPYASETPPPTQTGSPYPSETPPATQTGSPYPSETPPPTFVASPSSSPTSTDEEWCPGAGPPIPWPSPSYSPPSPSAPPTLPPDTQLPTPPPTEPIQCQCADANSTADIPKPVVAEPCKPHKFSCEARVPATEVVIYKCERSGAACNRVESERVKSACYSFGTGTCSSSSNGRSSAESCKPCKVWQPGGAPATPSCTATTKFLESPPADCAFKLTDPSGKPGWEVQNDCNQLHNIDGSPDYEVPPNPPFSPGIPRCAGTCWKIYKEPADDRPICLETSRNFDELRCTACDTPPPPKPTSSPTFKAFSQ